MNISSTRVRFAPSPTGMLHLGSVRVALLNYLFAKHNHGNFIIRLEDTDQQRDVDPRGVKILEDLHWLGLEHDEGPDRGGPYAPYMQSERSEMYTKILNELIAKKQVYRCFCSQEELEKKRARQIVLKLPPRYDRTCANISEKEINKHLADKTPFIWRFKIDETKKITINDMAHGAMHFDLTHFTDFPLTRQDGSFTFIFANFADDLTMKISHVIRGEDHLSNTANQAALYQAYNAILPTFWHLPIICNAEGKKLSKRDFGFSLRDLVSAGYLPEAICNYLGILGASFPEEIMSLDELARVYPFEHLSTTGHIKYDVKKLRWINHKWINRLTPKELTTRVLPFLSTCYPASAHIERTRLEYLIALIQTDMTTLADVTTALAFYFERPAKPSTEELIALAGEHLAALRTLIKTHEKLLAEPIAFTHALKQSAQEQKIPLKIVFSSLRKLLQGTTHGLALHDLIAMLGEKETRARLVTMLA